MPLPAAAARYGPETAAVRQINRCGLRAPHSGRGRAPAFCSDLANSRLDEEQVNDSAALQSTGDRQGTPRD